VLAVERLGLVGGRLALDGLVPPDVPALGPVDLLARTADDEHLLDQAGVLFDDLLAGFVDRGLEGGRGAPAVAAVCGDDHLRAAVDDARGEGVGREPAEDHGVRRPEAGAGQHRHDGLGDHRHVDRDAVAGLDAELGERVGRLADLVLELCVGDRLGVVRGLADPVQGDPVPPTLLDVPVDAVVGSVEPTADEPLGEGRVRPVEHLTMRFGPADPAGLLSPERQPVGGRLVVGLRPYVGALGQLGRGLEPALLAHEVLQPGLGRLFCLVVAHRCSSNAGRAAWSAG
jgi:hypothetical protein